jgi:hypothetical protein
MLHRSILLFLGSRGWKNLADFARASLVSEKAIYEFRRGRPLTRRNIFRLTIASKKHPMEICKLLRRGTIGDMKWQTSPS